MHTYGLANVTYVKPERALWHLEQLRRADWLLFPPYWLVNTLYYGLNKPVFPSISTYHLGHDKVEMTRAVQLLWPALMPQTVILANTARARHQILEQFEFPFVAKAVKGSMGNGVWLLTDTAAWKRYADEHEILYIQEYLPIERDLRLVVVGRRVIGAYWRRRPSGMFHTNVGRGGIIDPANVPAASIELVERMARQLNIDHAGFDVAEVSGRFYFFEFNRLFGTAGLKQLGVSIGSLIGDYLEQTTPPKRVVCI